VLYFANPTTGTRDAMTAGLLGFIGTPLQGNRRPAGVTWLADNGCFGKGFDEVVWFKWLQRHSRDAKTCVCATAPDVVGDAQATLERSLPWLPKIRALGYPAALVAQDGLEHLEVPWDEFDVLFIGGTTEWKLSAQARELVTEAKRRGKHVHCGRVNSLKRYRYMEAIGCDSVDGTYLVFGPDENLPKVLSWIRSLEETPALFDWRAS
jgi:hypothetical protein